MINNLICSALSSTQIRVTWDPPSQPNGVIRHYEVVLRNVNTLQNVTYFVNGQVTTATIGKLQANQGYYCSVAAHTIMRGESEVSMFVITREDGNYNSVFVTHYMSLISLIFCSVPSGAPLDMTSYDITRTSFKLNWTKIPFEQRNGHIVGYRIKVIGNDNAVQPLLVDTNTTFNATVSVTKPGTHCVSVAAMTSVGVGPYSESIIITTGNY